MPAPCQTPEQAEEAQCSQVLEVEGSSKDKITATTKPNKKQQGGRGRCRGRETQEVCVIFTGQHVYSAIK